MILRYWTATAAHSPNSSMIADSVLLFLIGSLQEQIESLFPLGPAPAIPRLAINPYQWGTECLSGDVGAGPATSFPQAIGMVGR